MPTKVTPKSYKKQAAKAVKTFKKNSKEVKLSGIQESDQRSSYSYNTRVLDTKDKKAKSMTYGGSRKGIAATIYKKRVK